MARKLFIALALCGCAGKQLPPVNMSDKVALDVLVLQTDCQLMKDKGQLDGASADVKTICEAMTK